MSKKKTGKQPVPSVRSSIIIAAVILPVTVLLFTIIYGKPGKNEIPDKGVVEIKEKMFATQVSDVYINAKDYLGKTIKLEGVFKREKYSDGEEPYNFVIRYGPGGCCGTDANIGFEVKWEKNHARPYPAAESWVEAEGELKMYDDGYYLYLDLASLTVLNRRGAETVLR